MKLKKILFGAMAAAAIGTMLFGMAACGGSAAKSTGTYLSENELTYTNMLPKYNYFFIVSTTQQLDTFDDNTYCLTVTTSMYSNISVGPDVPTGEETWNDRGQTITRYYGECTVTVDPEDESIVYVNISTPTRVVAASFGAATIDTSGEWTEAVVKASGAETATDYLAGKTEKFPTEGHEFMVSLKTCSFDQFNW